MTPIPPIDPSAVAGLGGDWQIQSVPELGQAELATPGPSEAGAVGGESFGSMLSQQLDNLSALQGEAASHSAALANGTASDPVSAVVAVEKAQLSMQFASQIRTRGAEALQEIFRSQI
jgi:flagellar hook-basal body complex protein FliE